MMVIIISNISIAHFIVLRIDEELKGFIIISDIRGILENNDYRYIRHASIRNEFIVFCSE